MQAPRAWFAALSQALTDLGFIASKCDSSLFMRYRGSEILYVLAYLDDLIITGSSTTAILDVIKRLNCCFPNFL